METVPTLSLPLTGPQSEAFEWLLIWIDRDPALPPREHILQRFALATLYYSTGGDISWKNRGDWLRSNVDECNWLGVSCLTTTGGVAQQDSRINDGTASFRKVDGIRLSSNGLVGTLPEELSLLTNLVSLRAENNTLQGEIPSTIGALTNLGKCDYRPRPCILVGGMDCRVWSIEYACCVLEEVLSLWRLDFLRSRLLTRFRLL